LNSKSKAKTDKLFKFFFLKYNGVNFLKKTAVSPLLHASIKSSLESAKGFLETLKSSDEEKLALLAQEAEKITQYLLKIDPKLLGESRYKRTNRAHVLGCDIFYGTRAFFSIKLGSVTSKLAHLQKINQSQEDLKTSCREKAQEIDRLSRNILKIESKFEEYYLNKRAEKAENAYTVSLFHALHESRKISILPKVKGAVKPAKVSLQSPPAIHKKVEPEQKKATTSTDKESETLGVSLEASHQSDHARFIEALIHDLASVGIPHEFSLELIQSLFPEVSAFARSEGGLFEIRFKGSFQFNGTLCGVKATITNPSILTITLDHSKKTLKFEKEKYTAKTGLGNGYLSALNFNKNGSVSLECLLKKGFYIPISGCYTYAEFKEAFGSIRWIPC